MNTNSTSHIGSRKTVIVGAGYVGSTIAYALGLRDIAREIILIDSKSEKASAEAWDIRHGIPNMGTADLRMGTYSDCEDAELIIITAGRNRQPGETRVDLASDNAAILFKIISSIRPHYSGSIVVLVSNPVDVLTQLTREWLDAPAEAIFGTGCMLDTSRFIRAIADYTQLSTGVVSGYIAGEHGDQQVPIWSSVTIGAIPIVQYCRDAHLVWDDEIKNRIAQTTRNMGAEIIQRKGRTHFGIATCASQLADAVLNQRPMIASVSVPMSGEYGFEKIALSVPCVIGPSGVQRIIVDTWDPFEQRAFRDSALAMTDHMRNIHTYITA